jgi:hypothetical protein
MPYLILIAAVGAIYFWGSKPKPPVSDLNMTTPAWAMVAEATIDAKQKPKNGATVAKILATLAKQSISSPSVAASFAAAALAVTLWNNGKSTYSQYRTQLSEAFKGSQSNSAVQALLAASLPG